VVKEELLDAIGVEGAGEEIALGEDAAEFAQALHLQFGFHVLGDYPQIQIAGEFEDELHGIATVAVGGHGADQRAINLDFVEGPAAKPGERAKTGTEVAEAEANSKPLDMGEDFGGGLEVGDRGRFGNFELKGRGREARILNGGAQAVDEFGVGELAR